MTSQHNLDNEYNSEEFLRRIQEFFQNGGEPQEEEPASHFRREKPSEFHQEPPEEQVAKFRQKIGKLEKELEQVLEKFREQDIPFFFTFMVSLNETKHEREGVWGLYSYNVESACELMAMMTVYQMPHAFSHLVIGSSAIIDQLLKGQSSFDSDSDSNEF